MNEILKKIDNYLNQNEYEISLELEFFEKVIDTPALIKISELFLMVARVENNSLSFVEEKQKIETLFQNISFINQYKKFFAFFSSLLNCIPEEKKILLSFMKTGTLDKIVADNLEKYPHLNTIFYYLTNNKITFSDFLSVIKYSPKVISMWFSLCNFYKENNLIQDELDNEERLIPNNDNSVLIMQKPKEQTILAISSDMMDFLTKTGEYRDFLKEQDNIKRKNIRKIKDTLLQLKNEIKKFNSGQYISISPKILNKLPFDLFYEISMDILKINEEIYKKNREKTKEKFDLNQLLKEYSFKNRFSAKEKEEVLKEKTKEEIEEMLKYLLNINNFIVFTNQELITILTKSNVEKIITINSCIMCGFMENDYIKKNLSLYYDESNKIVAQNKEFIISRRINCKNLNHLLVLESFSLYIALAEKYGFNSTDANVIQNMARKHFFDYLDQFIELDLGDYIRQNTNILNEDLENIIKRIIISNSLSIPIWNEEKKLHETRIVKGTDFFIPESELDKYILDVTPYYLDENAKNSLDEKERITFLDNCELDYFYKKDEFTYLINGQLISRIKVLRNLKCTNDIKASVLYGTINNQIIEDNLKLERIKQWIN